MISQLKNFLIISLKNAVNAILINGGLMALFPTVFHMHSAAGWWNLGKAALDVVIVREAVVWIPILMSWSKTDADPSMKIFTSRTTEAATDAAGAPVTVEKTVTVEKAPPVTPKP